MGYMSMCRYAEKGHFKDRRPKLRMVSYCLILKMAVNIKDLYGNSGKRSKKRNTR